MVYVRSSLKSSGGGIPAQLQTDMDAVLNKKFGTSTTYPSTEWADDVNLMGLLPVRSASGAIASFSDGADDVPIKSGKFTFNAVQASGTPTPSVPIPISGFTGMDVYHTGRNLANSALEIGTFRESSAAGTSYENMKSAVSNRARTENIIWIPYNTKITLSCDSNYLLFYTLFDINGLYLAQYSSSFGNPVTITKNAYYIALAFKKTDNSDISQSDLADIKLQIEVGDSASTYEAFGTTYPVTWSEEGTLYGGYVKVNSDGSAELWKTHEIVDMGDLSWTYTNSVFRATLSDGVVLSSANISPDYLCSCYLPKASGNSAKWSDDLVCWHGTGSYSYVYVTNSNYTDADVFATAMTGQKLVYPLATPVKVADLPDISISTLLGTNNIFHDANGESGIEYRGDISKSYEVSLFSGTKSTNTWGSPIEFTGIDISKFAAIRLTGTQQGSAITYRVFVEDIPANAEGQSSSDFLALNTYLFVRRNLSGVLYAYIETGKSLVITSLSAWT